jgi:hypothetical protein
MELIPLSKSIYAKRTVPHSGSGAGLMRNTLIDCLRYLDEAGVTRSLHRDVKGISRL